MTLAGPLPAPLPSPVSASMSVPGDVPYGDAAAQRYGITSGLRSEWIKLRTVRSTWWTVLAMIVLTVGIAAIAGIAETGNWKTAALQERLVFDPTAVSLRGLLFSQLVIGVLGVLVISSEYGTGTIRSTLAAIPNRPMVLATKAAVFAAVALFVGEALSFAGFFVGQSLLRSPAPHATLLQPDVLRAVVGGGMVVAVLGLFALGLASIIRHTAGAITTYVGVLLVVPIIIQALPSSINHAVGKYLPFNISDVMTSTRHAFDQPPSLSPWTGFALLCGYAVAALTVGGWLMVRRDA